MASIAGQIAEFSINGTTGALTLLARAACSTGAGSAPQNIALDRTGTYLYVTLTGDRGGNDFARRTECRHTDQLRGRRSRPVTSPYYQPGAGSADRAGVVPWEHGGARHSAGGHGSAWAVLNAVRGRS